MLCHMRSIPWLVETWQDMHVLSCLDKSWGTRTTVRILCYYYAKPKPGLKRFMGTLKPFDIEFQPFIEEINAKEGVIRECADAATMERIKGMIL